MISIALAIVASPSSTMFDQIRPLLFANDVKMHQACHHHIIRTILDLYAAITANLMQTCCPR